MARYELRVHSDGDKEIRKVPQALVCRDPETLVFEDSDSLSAELGSYGCSDEAIEEALQEADEEELRWVGVRN